jgi:hypothetical protein
LSGTLEGGEGCAGLGDLEARVDEDHEVEYGMEDELELLAPMVREYNESIDSPV